ncbi:MAG: non-ribosomal peptide synthetase, partial [bacterium]|nr:non-ribosomal peptide synthetase [bacterium]
KATILASKIHKQWSVKFPLADIFENPTIAAMAKHIKGKKQDVYATIEATEKREYYRLSSAQSRLYFMQQMNLDGIGYNMSSTLYFDKDLDIVLLETAFKQLILKHESLRTSFRMVNEEPVQRIHEAVDFRIEYCQETTTGHWTWGGNRDSEAALSLDMPGFKEILRNFVRPFDLSIAPLLRAGLISVGDTKVLLLDMHHIVSDGASQELLSKEFQALMGGNPLPPLKLQYRDYSHWQNSMEQQERIAKHEGYWLNVFAGKIPQLNLPTDFPRSNAHTLEGDFRNFEIKPEHTRKLKEMCRENDATLFMNLLAIFNVFLHHYTGNSDIIVGCDVLGRPHSDLQDIIGMFVNMLPMRNTPTGDKTYLEFLKDVRDNSFEAFENQDMQFEKLVDRLGLPRQVSRNPLFDVQFALQTHAVFIDREKPELGGSMENADLQYIDKKSVFDLGLEAEETGEKIVFRLSYSTRLFKDETIERMVLYIKEIISAVIKNPGIAVSEIEMVSEEEERELLAIINESEERGNTVDMSEAPDNPGHSQAEFDF